MPTLSYSPSIAPEVVEARLSRLMVRGRLYDQKLIGRIKRLDECFKHYTNSYPYGIWAPGLILTPEMRSLTEALFPMAGIAAAFSHLFRMSLTFTPFHGASAIHTAATWPDALQSLAGTAATANPAVLLQSFIENDEARRHFIFGNFLPIRYGGGFRRYPKQREFLKQWLEAHKPSLAGGIRCLDAACGCGEGTYDLAKLLLQLGWSPQRFNICGSTLEPLELFAAAHCFFPHQASRQETYREQVACVFETKAERSMVFCQENLLSKVAKPDRYHVILCNGILGGPFMHDRRSLEAAIERLAERMVPGGILVAADRFHEGWKKKVPAELIRDLLVRNGFEVHETGEGVAGVKTG